MQFTSDRDIWRGKLTKQNIAFDHHLDLIIENENNGNYEKTINNNYIFIGLLKLFIN